MSNSPSANPGRPVRVAKSHQGLLSNRPVQGFPGHLFGHYIWDKELSDRFLVLRKRFECDRAPERALLHITAAHRYQLFMNGEYIGRGPCRNVHPDWTRYDTHDITARLRPGANSIVVLAFVLMKGIGRYPDTFSSQRIGGLFVQAELFDGDTCTVVATDDTWRVRRPDRYRCDTPTASGYMNIPTEYVEADKDQGEWVKIDFDDRAWPTAFIHPATPKVSNGRKDLICCLEPRPTPLLRERGLVPTAIVQAGEIDSAVVAQLNDIAPFGEMETAKRLWYSPLLPLELASITDINNLLGQQGNGVVMRSYAGEGGTARDPVVILDFGRPVVGMPELIFETEPGAVVEIAYAESMRDGKVQFYCDSGVHARRLADRYVAGAGRQTWKIFEPRMAIRYLQVVSRTGGRPARLLSARIVALEYPVEERGRFECSDETLTRLWRAAVDTVFLAMEDVLCICSIRERQYMMLIDEIEQQHLTVYAAYGDLAITEAGFTDTARGQDASGNWPGANIINHEGPIKNGALYYPSSVLRRHQHFGKDGFVEAQYPAIVRLLGWFERHSDADGLLYNLTPMLWTDSSDTELNGANLEINALYAKSLMDAAVIADELGRTREAGAWRRQAEKIRTFIRQQHWDEANGCFRDSIIDGRQSRHITELSNAMALLFGIASESQSARVAENLVTWSKLPATPDADADVSSLRCFATMLENGLKISRVSPLYLWHVIDAMVQAGREAEAWAYLSARYGWLLEGTGPHCLHESWADMRKGALNASSSIHGGGAGVAFLLSCQALGVQPLEPGFKRAMIEPRIGLLKWARGVFPSARGDIAVDWRRNGKKFELDVTLPAGMDCELVVPVLDGSSSVTHNGASCAVTGDGRTLIKVCGGKHNVSSGR